MPDVTATLNTLKIGDEFRLRSGSRRYTLIDTVISNQGLKKPYIVAECCGTAFVFEPLRMVWVEMN